MDYEKAYKQLMENKRKWDAIYRERHADEIRIRFKAWYEKNKVELSAKRKLKRMQGKAMSANLNN